MLVVGKVAAIAAETNAALMKIFDLKTDADVARAAAADHTLPWATLRIRPRTQVEGLQSLAEATSVSFGREL